MFPTQYQQDRFFDAGWRNHAWAGNLDLLRDWSDGIYPDEHYVADPQDWSYYVGSVAHVGAIGILTRSAWLRLAAEIDEAAAAPRTRCLWVTLSTVAQQLNCGYSRAEEALIRASWHAFTVVYIDCAFGVALPWAHRARLVVASPAAPIGWFSAGYPWGQPEHFPDPSTWHDVIWNFDGCRKPPHREACSLLGPEECGGLLFSSLHGEQLEGSLVHRVEGDPVGLIERFARKGRRR